MSAPTVQLGRNGSEVELFWDVLASQVGEGYFTIYYAMERSGPFVALGTAPNLPSYGKKSILHTFLRSSQGMGEENSFYVAGTYTDGSMVTSPMGDLKFVPAVVSQARWTPRPISSRAPRRHASSMKKP